MATSLKAAWDSQEEECEAMSGIIVFGTLYGADETKLNNRITPTDEVITVFGVRRRVPESARIPACKIPSMYRGSCGHVFSDILCSDAFEMAAGRLEEPQCNSGVEFTSPLCGHRVQLPCWAHTAIQTWTPWGGNNITPDAISDHCLVVHDGAEPPAVLKKVMKTLCKETIPLTRGCDAGHVKSIPCSDLYAYLILRSPLPHCLEIVEKQLECSHFAKMKCNKLHDPSPPCNAPIKERFMHSCGEHYTDVRVCRTLTDLRQRKDMHCLFTVPCSRYQCGHSATTTCHLKASVEKYLPGDHLLPLEGAQKQAVVYADTVYCASAAALPPCTDPVAYCSPCGHRSPAVPCHEAFSWASGMVPAPPCRDVVERTSPLCGHTLQLSCFNSKVIEAWRPWRAGGVDEEEDVYADDGLDMEFEIPEFDAVAFCDERGDTVTHISLVQDEMQPGPAPLPVEALLCDGSTFLRRGMSRVNN